MADPAAHRARRLPEATDLPVDRTAEEAGLGTGASLRRHMSRSIGVAPPACRQTFRAAPPGPRPPAGFPAGGAPPRGGTLEV
ncbi:hypothetical protein [Streptomyces toxytricini]|uniref:hypothetical protein n=1 Tax=Streptomyces toxytricini TaxID=67369 RepID=UPI003F4D905D